MRAMHSAAQYQPHASPSASRLTLVEVESPPEAQPVGVSAAWRKLLMQAEMAAPHVQVAAIEGEHGAGKHTLARYLFSRSPLAAASFQRRDAREWLVTDADPATLAGFTYLDRVDLLAPPGQGLLLGVLKALQDRPPGRFVLLASSQTSLRQMAAQGLLLPDLAFRLTAVRFAIPPLRQRREDISVLAQSLLDRICTPLSAAPRHSRPRHAGPPAAAQLAGKRARAGRGPGDRAARSRQRRHPPRRPGPALRPRSRRSMRSSRHARTDSLNLDAVIQHHVQYVLDLNRGNKLRAARQLGISRSTLYRILGNETILAH